MATDPIKKIYLYNAHGYGLGGRIDRPFQHVLDVHAGASLPTTGGFEVSRAENYRLNETISYRAAHTMVSGSLDEEDGTYNTLASATIEGLNILDMVTADRIVAHVASKQRLDDPEPTITPIGSHFENLRIAGCPIHAELDNNLFNWFGGDKFPESKGIVLCSLVKDIKTPCPELRVYGNVIVVPQFGKIYLGEVILKKYEREVTMLRLDLGCPTALVVSGPGGGGGGAGFP